jgi:hypothetical protein
MFKMNFSYYGIVLAAALIASSHSSSALAFENEQGTDQERHPIMLDDTPTQSFVFKMAPFAETSTALGADGTYIRSSVSEGPVGAWSPGSDHALGTTGVVEAGVRGRNGSQLGFGEWQYAPIPNEAAPLTASSPPPIQKFYFHAKKSFYEQDGQKITGFLRIGHGPGDLDSSTGAWGAGIIITGMFPSRPDGQFDFTYTAGTSLNGNAGVPASARFSSGVGSSMTGFEKRLEFVYKDKINERITIEPGLTVTSGASPTDPVTTNGLLIGLRINIKLP